MLRVDISEEASGVRVGRMTIGRLVLLDLSDKDAIADVVCPYRVRIDGRIVGEVSHRYGDGAWALVRKALDLTT